MARSSDVEYNTVHAQGNCSDAPGDLEGLSQPSYRENQDPNVTAKQIQLYYKNATSEVVAEHGVSREELDRLAPQIREITESMQQQRDAGELAYRDLPYQKQTVETITALAQKLQGKYDNLVILGIGGSALGSIALQTALNSPTYNFQDNAQRGGPRLFVIDNVDPAQFGALLEHLESQLDRTLFNVVSKSGRTAETASQFLTIVETLKTHLPDGKLTDHIIATTDPSSGTLRGIVEREGLTSLVVPDGVGGRFSVLSDVGLFGAAMCGIDIEQLLAGAADMDRRVQSADLFENPAAIYGAIQYALYQKGKPLSVMMPYSYQLKDLADWFRQLWAESLGKAVDVNGKEVHTGPTPINALGTTDQHSQVQLYREGPNDKVFTFLEVTDYGRDVVIGPAGPVEELSYLSQRSMTELINVEKQATEYALLQSQRPCLTIKFPHISPHTVGQFIYLFEVTTSYVGGLLNINAYDQPAVELGKEATFALMGHEKYQDLLKEIQATCQIDEDFVL